VDDVLFMGVLQRLGDLRRNAQGFVDLNWPCDHALGQVEARHKLHDEVVRLAGILDAINLGDVGMIQRCQQACFALEPRQPVGVAGELRRKNFDGYLAPELGVVSAVDLAHSPRADQRQDLVGTETCACLYRHALADDTRTDAAGAERKQKPLGSPARLVRNS
jgi:hypothetical protein